MQFLLMRQARKAWVLLKVVVALAMLFVATPVGRAATLTLTPAGIADGFTLTTFATLNPGAQNTFNFGPFGVAVASNGNVIVSNDPNSTRYAFLDVDGQTAATALNSLPSSSTTIAYASAGGQAYGGDGLGHFVQFNPNGTINHILTGVTASPDLGMWGNPVNGHILASSSSGLIDIDPLANGGNGSSRVVNSAGNGDGVSVSPDGTIVYSEQGNIIGYNIATGLQVFNSGSLSSAGLGAADGTGVISSTNALNGDIVINFNGGGVALLDPNSHALTVIANGGSRGDYVSPDTSNGSLFLDYSEGVYRLSCGPNCSIGGGPQPGVPEPATVTLFGASAFSLYLIRRRRVR
jgi:hypothetical protein